MNRGFDLWAFAILIVSLVAPSAGALADLQPPQAPPAAEALRSQAPEQVNDVATQAHTAAVAAVANAVRQADSWGAQILHAVPQAPSLPPADDAPEIYPPGEYRPPSRQALLAEAAAGWDNTKKVIRNVPAPAQATDPLDLVVGTLDSLMGSLLLFLGYEPETASSDASGAAAPRAAGQQAREGFVQAVAEAAKPALMLFLMTGSTLGAAAIDLRPSMRRQLLLGPMPFYSRLKRKDLLEHGAREKLHEIIDKEPGVTLQELVDRLQASRNAVAYHLYVMERQSLIASKRIGRSRHYFINGGRFEEGVKQAMGTIKNPTTLGIGHFIRDNPGMPQKAICQRFVMSPTAAHWHLRKLEHAGLVNHAKSGKEVHYAATPLWGQLPPNAPAVVTTTFTPAASA